MRVTPANRSRRFCGAFLWNANSRWASDTDAQQLSLHGTERQHSFTENLIKHLREAGVDRGETAEDPFVTGEMFEGSARIRVVAERKQEEQNRQRPKNDL